MEKKIEKLIFCMEKELNIYFNILKLVREERDLLVANKEIELDKNLKTQDDLILLASQEEKSRISIMEEITRTPDMGIYSQVTISEILKKLEGIQKNSISQLRDQLKKIIAKIKEINQNNILLIVQGRGNIKNFLDILINRENGSIYLKNGKIKLNSNTTRSLINKVV
jgi:flagellar biosynthesis/type III secretory pathway chaperone